jgi:hypothetical protein
MVVSAIFALAVLTETYCGRFTLAPALEATVEIARAS